MNRRIFGLSILTISLAMLVGASIAQTAPKMTDAERQALMAKIKKEIADAKANATLHIGDSAPAVNFTWIKGKGSTDFNDGKVHVVEFWATWCGPCRASMPNLSALSRRYRDQVEFASVAVWPNAHTKNKNAPYEDGVIDFARHSGGMMDYPVGMDSKDGYMADHWLKASGTLGIPCAFIVDKHGKVAWFSTPALGLDKALELALDDKLDAVTGEKIKTDCRAGWDVVEKDRSEAEKDLRDGKADEALQAVDDADRAMPFAAEELWATAFDAHLLKGKEEAATYADDVLKNNPTSASALFWFAQDIMKDDPPSAVKLINGAMRCAIPNEPVFNMGLAKAYALAGDYANAAKCQQRALIGLNDPTNDEYLAMIDPQTKVLQGYQEKLKN